MFKPVSPKVDFPKLEERIIKFWKKNKIFEKSVERKPQKGSYSHYDGPPFVTGLPHYGGLLSSIAKDIIPRYQTMKGKRVRRVWGWDCHGLPAETQVEKKLGLKSKKDIEKFGIDKFIRACRTYVAKTSAEWEWYVDRVGRWVDFKNAYKTMDLSYMETVMWIFKQLYEKGLIYKGRRVSLFCTRCSTPISNFEIAMDGTYQMVEDPTVTVKFKIKNKDKYLLAWTTTPWTLPANLALAVDKDEGYVEVKEAGQTYILAEKRLSGAMGKKTEIIKRFKGKDLVGMEYEPLYKFFKTGKRDFRVYAADFVSMSEGTGLVHVAPGFGEEDTGLGEAQKLSFILSVDEEGRFVDQVKPWAGVYIKDADPKIIEDLKARRLLYRAGKITHSYPFCHRCVTPLIYKSQEAWFLSVTKLKEQMLKSNERVNWIPKHFKHGRFKKGIESAPDWCISRTRYWGSPLPVWECDCGERFIPGSFEELEKLSGQKVKDLHRPDIDKVTIKCGKCGKKARRVPEVLDCWFESGSVPYAERHYPFENKKEFEKSFPADFISEYTGQLRGWFYVLHVISNALLDSIAFKNVLVTGVILGSDGRKMSKSFGNYPDPKIMLNKHGGDALRLYLLGSPVMLGKDILISEEEYSKQVKTTLLILWNIYRYFVTYANVDRWKPRVEIGKRPTKLDLWILTRLDETIIKVTESLNSYDTPTATQIINDFIQDLSTWYLRRSRERMGPTTRDKKDKDLAYSVLYTVLVTLTKVLAPFIPFLAEEIYKNLTERESVHLENWPEVKTYGVLDKKLLADMKVVRKICELGHAARKEAKIKVRQPLQSIKVKTKTKLDLGNELVQLIKEELNVKEVFFKGEPKRKEEMTVELETKITPELKAEGEDRELVRQIQQLRKENKCRLDEAIDVITPRLPHNQEFVSHATIARGFKKGKRLAIKK